jgi:hypothetical protein
MLPAQISRDVLRTLRGRINAAQPGEIVDLESISPGLIPEYIAVSLNEDTSRGIPQECSIDPASNLRVIPIGMDTEPTIIVKPDGSSVNVMRHAVELAFAVTAAKVQGQTESKLILALNKRSFPPYLTFQTALVLFTRVKKLDDLRVLPAANGAPNSHNLSYISTLRPPSELVAWFRGLPGPNDGDRRWNAERAIRYHEQFAKTSSALRAETRRAARAEIAKAKHARTRATPYNSPDARRGMQQNPAQTAGTAPGDENAQNRISSTPTNAVSVTRQRQLIQISNGAGPGDENAEHIIDTRRSKRRALRVIQDDDDEER